MSMATGVSPLRLVRQPGDAGPILSVSGELTGPTAEALRQELQLLTSTGHPAVTLDLSACRLREIDALLVLLETLRQAIVEDRRVVLVVGRAGSEGPGEMERLLKLTGIEQHLVVFPSVEAATRSLLEELPSPGEGEQAVPPVSWETVRAKSVAFWRDLRDALDTAPTAELIRRLTSMTPLCERAQAAWREHPVAVAWFCEHCPLFHALGGRPADVGCRSARDPVIAALRTGDLDGAGALIDKTIQVLSAMPLPDQPAKGVAKRRVSAL